MLLETLSQDFRKVRTVNATDASFPSRVPTITDPAGIGDNAAQATASAVFEARQPSGVVSQNGLLIVPFGAGSDDATFSLRVIGWRRVFLPGHEGNTIYRLWVPITLVELLCTLGTSVGIAGNAVIDTDRFCDTLSLTTGDAGVSCDLVSPNDNTIAHAVVDMKGFQRIEITTSTGSSATNGNAILAFL